MIVSASALSGLLRVSGSYHTVVLAPCVGSTARPADNGEAVVGERIAISDFGTACAGQNLAGSSDDGAEPGNASVGRHGRLIQSESHQAFCHQSRRDPPARHVVSQAICVSETPDHGCPRQAPCRSYRERVNLGVAGEVCV